LISATTAQDARNGNGCAGNCFGCSLKIRKKQGESGS
jgi:hypothetical protein